MQEKVRFEVKKLLKTVTDTILFLEKNDRIEGRVGEHSRELRVYYQIRDQLKTILEEAC